MNPKFSLKQAVVLSVTPGIWVPAKVIKVSYTETAAWYGVRVDNGAEFHGIPESGLQLVN